MTALCEEFARQDAEHIATPGQEPGGERSEAEGQSDLLTAKTASFKKSKCAGAKGFKIKNPPAKVGFYNIYEEELSILRYRQ